MTSVNGEYDFEYKVGDVEQAGVQLLQNGDPINLENATVVFNMAFGGTRKTLTCNTGGTVNGRLYEASEGGATLDVTSTATASTGLYQGEFVITIGTSVAHCPSGNVYYLFKIWESK